MKMRDGWQESHRARVKLITVNNNNNNKRVERNNNLRDASQGGDPDWKSMRR